MSISEFELNLHLSIALDELRDVVQLLDRIAGGELKTGTQEFNDAMLAYLTERCFDSKSCEGFVLMVQQHLKKQRASS